MGNQKTTNSNRNSLWNINPLLRPSCEIENVKQDQELSHASMNNNITHEKTLSAQLDQTITKTGISSFSSTSFPNPRLKTIPEITHDKRNLNSILQHSSKYSKLLNAQVYLLNDQVLPGGIVNGTVDLTCHTKSKLKLGKIDVFLIGFEELVKNQGRNNFLTMVYPLQNMNLAPTDIVVAGTPDEHGCWLAQKTSTKLNFAFKLPLYTESGKKIPLPSSFSDPSVGYVSYFIVLSIQIKVKNRLIEKPLQVLREFQVFEAAAGSQSTLYSDITVNHIPDEWRESQIKTCQRWNWFKTERGDISMQVNLKPSDAVEDQLIYKSFQTIPNYAVYVSGSTGFLDIKIKNDTNFKNIDQLDIHLIQRWKTFEKSVQEYKDGTEDQFFHPLSFYRTKIQSKKYKHFKTVGTLNRLNELNKQDKRKLLEWWPGVEAGKSIEFLGSIELPTNIWTVRYAELLEITFAVQVVTKSKGQEVNKVEIPIHVVHPLSTMINLPVLRTKGADIRKAISLIDGLKVTQETNIVEGYRMEDGRRMGIVSKLGYSAYGDGSSDQIISREQSSVGFEIQRQQSQLLASPHAMEIKTKESTQLSIVDLRSELNDELSRVGEMKREIGSTIKSAGRFLTLVESSPSIESECVVEDYACDMHKKSQNPVQQNMTYTNRHGLFSNLPMVSSPLDGSEDYTETATVNGSLRSPQTFEVSGFLNEQQKGDMERRHTTMYAKIPPLPPTEMQPRVSSNARSSLSVSPARGATLAYGNEKNRKSEQLYRPSSASIKMTSSLWNTSSSPLNSNSSTNLMKSTTSGIQSQENSLPVSKTVSSAQSVALIPPSAENDVWMSEQDLVSEHHGKTHRQKEMSWRPELKMDKIVFEQKKHGIPTIVATATSETFSGPLETKGSFESLAEMNTRELTNLPDRIGDTILLIPEQESVLDSGSQSIEEEIDQLFAQIQAT